MQGPAAWVRSVSLILLAAGVVAQDAQEVLRRAAELRKKGDKVGAIALLDAAIRSDTKDARLWLVRAELRHQTGALDEALADCDRGLALLVPEGIVVASVRESEKTRSLIGASLSLRGHVRGGLGDWSGAAKDFTDATTLMPRDVDAWRNRAAAEWSLGRLDDSVASRGKAIEASEGKEVLDYLMRHVAHQLAGHHADAGADLERAAALAAGTPQFAEVDLNRAVLATAFGDTIAARAACDRVWGASPQLAGWAALLRWSNAGPGERVDATQRLREDFAAKPADDPLVAEMFRLCADGTGDADGMALAGRDSTARCPLWYFGACRAAQLGRDADARLLFLRCVNSGRPDYKQWRIAFARLRAIAGKSPLQVALGATVAAVPDATVPTLVVTGLAADSAAAIQGLQRGDQIVRVADQPATVAAFEDVTKTLGIGAPVRFMVARGDATTALVLTMGVATP